MSGDYLGDRSGEPDPEIQRLERSLASLGAGERPLELPETIETPAQGRAPRRRGGITRIWSGVERPALPGDMTLFGIPTRAWAVAAGVLAVAGAVALWAVTHRAVTWRVASLEGAPRVSQSPIAANGRLAV